jgi:O-antigen ligase
VIERPRREGRPTIPRAPLAAAASVPTPARLTVTFVAVPVPSSGIAVPAVFVTALIIVTVVPVAILIIRTVVPITSTVPIIPVST